MIAENFVVERSATRIHHPTPENATGHYRALHHTVSLKEDRAKLPEWAKYAGMRYESQIHTILKIMHV